MAIINREDNAVDGQRPQSGARGGGGGVWCGAGGAAGEPVGATAEEVGGGFQERWVFFTPRPIKTFGTCPSHGIR